MADIGRSYKSFSHVRNDGVVFFSLSFFDLHSHLVVLMDYHLSTVSCNNTKAGEKEHPDTAEMELLT